MKVAQCDNCRSLGPIPPIGWINAVVIEPPSACSGEGWVTRYMGNADSSNTITGIFCSWQCLAEYATARTLLDGLIPA